MQGIDHDLVVKGLAARYGEVCADVAVATRSVGRLPGDVRIVAVSKTVEARIVRCAMEAGMCDFGENRPDALAQKQELLPDANWHFIGNIQSRRIKDIVGRAVLIHSVDRLSTICAIDTRAALLGIVQPILLEVNVSAEESKSGFRPDEVAQALENALECAALRVDGLMTMAPQGDLDIARSTFCRLRELRDRLATTYAGECNLHELSCGMSEDYREAIEEGATIIRVGRRIFSEDFESVSI